MRTTLSCAGSSSAPPGTATTARPLQPLEVLRESRRGPVLPLPPRLRRLYGGDLRLRSALVYANFVSSIDGVVAVEDAPSSGALISGKSQADRFVMGLLRATADAVLLGAGTLRATPGHLWTAQHVYPSLSREWKVLRLGLGKAAEPRLVVMTASGDLDGSHPALRRNALVLTTTSGARRARAAVPVGSEVRVIARGSRVPVPRVLETLRSLGYAAVLSEAGGVVMGQLVRERCVDELFLTLSPVLAGRVRGDGNKGLVEGVHLLPKELREMRLAAVRRQQSHLFLRYSKA